VGCGNLKVVFDVGHCHHTGHNIEQDVKDIGGLLGHLHISDNHGKLDEHLAPGMGTVNFPEFIKCLKDNSYEGLYMFELRKCDRENLMYCHKIFNDWVSAEKGV
jgi:sugar phosphate isomerase/epimerase